MKLTRRMTIESLEQRRLLHGSAASLPFTTGLSLRLVGDEVTTSGTDVVLWTDQSGNGNDVAPTGGTPQVSHGALNGHDVIVFDGVDDSLGTNAFNLPLANADRTVYMLADYQGPGWGGFLYGANSDNHVFGVAASPNDQLSVFGRGPANNFESQALAISAGWVTQAIVLDSTSSEVRQYANGGLIAQNAHAFNTGNSSLRIGASLDNSTFVDMDVAEILVFDRVLSSSEMAQLDQYFQTEYALSPRLFRDELVAQFIDFPMAADFLPDGRMLVAQRNGGIAILDPAATSTTSTSYMTVPNVVFSPGELGMQDILVDPNFATNGYIYVYYSRDDGVTQRLRLSRFTDNGDGTADPNSEFVVWEPPTTWTTADHQGGNLEFASDGTILLLTGDQRTPTLSQDLLNPQGKLLRLNPDGTIPSNNPFVGNPNALEEIYSYGLRNPFRAGYDPSTNRLIVGDVGGNDQNSSLEEINIIDLDNGGGENFGWPDCQGSTLGNCAGTNPPAFQYPHAGTGAAIIGGVVYSGNSFPSQFNGVYFYADFVRNWINYLEFDASGNVVADVPFAQQVPLVVNIEQGPIDGALYYVSLNAGEVRRIVAETGQLFPTITEASASPTSGAVGLAVNFSGAATGVGTLNYRWDFGDGNEAFVPSPTHIYQNVGPYVAQLFVTDDNGTSVSQPIAITVGNPPTATINNPTPGLPFIANDVITFNGSGTDLEDGTLSPSSLQWEVVFLHDAHTHPKISGFVGTGSSFTINNTGHDYRGDTGYRITLTVTDSSGLTDSTFVEIFPQKVDVTFDSNPQGLIVTIDDVTVPTPAVYDTIPNFQHVVTADAQCLGGTAYTFNNWSDGGAQTHAVLVPSSNASAVANFTPAGSCAVPIDDSYALQPSFGGVAYFNDFDGNVTYLTGVTGGISGAGGAESVQGYSAHGFSGNFWRNASSGNPAAATRLTLANLPPHSTIDLNFLLAIIDSWDGNGSPSGPDNFEVKIDGVSFFSEAFNNGFYNPGTQSYNDPPIPGVELVREQALGFTAFNLDFRDSGYDMGMDPAFDNIPHTASTLTIEFFASGPFWSGTIDESWAVENIEVVLDGGPSGSVLNSAALGLPSVLDNDLDADGDPLTASLLNGPLYGSVVLNSNGSFVYTHDGTSAASDGFTYRVNDGTALSEVVATATVNLRPNNSPIAQDDVFATNKDAILPGNLLADNGNGVDLDPEGDPLSVIRVDGDPASVNTQLVLASGALLTVNSNGTFTYDPNGQFDGLQPGQQATDGFAYTLYDANSGLDTASVTININGTANSPPVAVNDSYVFTPGSSTQAYFNDFDGGESFGAGVTGGRSGSGTIEAVQGYAAHGFAGNLLRNAVDAPSVLTLSNLPAHDSIDLNFLLAMIDSWDGIGSPTGPDSFEVTIDGVSYFSEVFNNSFYVPGTQTYNVPPIPGVELARQEDLGFTAINLDFRDSAYDLGMDPAFDDIPHTASTLTIEFLAAGPALQGDGDESFGLENLEVILNSGSGSSVLDTNAAGLPTLLDNDTDIDLDPLTIAEVQGSAANVGTQITLPSGALLTVRADGSLVYDLNGAATSGDTFTYRVADGALTSNLASVTIDISGGSGSNTAPVAVNDSYAFTRGNGTSTQVYFNDFDGGESFDTGITGGLTGSGTIEAVQGYAAHGFAGNLLRNAVDAPSVLTLSNLPAHDSIDLNFLLAMIDSWDGIGSPTGPDSFEVTIDGVSYFSEVFNNSFYVPGTQTYNVPPIPGVELARQEDLGFTAINLDFRDSAYDLGMDPAFDDIPHTASTLTIEFLAAGPALQGDGDESFGLENLEVILNSGSGSSVLDTNAAGLPTLLDNDTDIDLDPLTIAEVQGSAANVGTQITLPSGALLTVRADGSLVYDLNGAATSGDTFTYRVADGALTSNLASVTIDISGGSGSNTAPVAVNDSYAFTRGNGTSTQVYFNDFDGDAIYGSGVTGGLTGPGLIELVQGYSAYGFAGNLHRNNAPTSIPTVLTLSNLPAHDSIDLNFLLAIIDSWDGIGGPNGPDSFNVSIDGAPIFSEVFNNAFYVPGTQTYNVPPIPNVELVRQANLGFRAINLDFRDSGYDLGLDPAFDNIPHTASTLTIEFFTSGPNWQGNLDESFGIENLEVLLNSASGSSVLDTSAEGLPTVLDNDTDADSDTLVAVLLSDPSAGSVVLSADGSFVYTFTGFSSTVDSFTYQVDDGTTLSNVATVTINVDITAPVPQFAAFSVASVAGADDLVAQSFDESFLADGNWWIGDGVTNALPTAGAIRRLSRFG